MSDLSLANSVGTKLSQGDSNPTLLDLARQQYPVLNQYQLQYKMNPKPNSGFLEYWPPDEAGTPDRPRPSDFDLKQPGLEVYDKNTRPIDILGDVVSHQMVNSDPVVSRAYGEFKGSITPDQQNVLKEQYEYAKTNEGEDRPFDQWAELSGLPAMFRGYAFQQWPKEFNDKVYTPAQKQKLDDMMRYLGGSK